MSKYAQHFNAKRTPQGEAIPGREAEMVKNSAGGFTFQVDNFARLDRFLVLGSEGGSYYAGEKKLTQENAKGVLACLKEDGVRAVDAIVAVSDAGRAPKNDPAVFALALAASFGDEKTKKAAFAALPKVCRIGTHLFQFAEAVDGLRGWGRGLRQAVAAWYANKSPRDLAFQVSKYQQREGWSHRDLLRLSHPKFGAEDTRGLVARWAVKGWDALNPEQQLEPAVLPLYAFELAKKAGSAAEVVRLIREYGLVRECIPTQYLNDAAVWEALLEKMPVTALVRNLGNLTKNGVVAPLSAGTRRALEILGDVEGLKKARVHPMTLLIAMKQYETGRSLKGSGVWTPVPQVIDALDAAFYAAFAAVEPTDKRWLLALDVSGSMGSPISGSSLTCRDASAAMALVTAATERAYHAVGFTSQGGGYGGRWGSGQNGLTPLAISPRQRLTDAVKAVSGLPFGGTDCALPMVYATAQKLPVDVFVVYTDNETWHGSIHPSQALKEYRQKMGIPAKLIVVAMTASPFTIADPNDAGMLDVVGFDATAPAVMAEFARG